MFEHAVEVARRYTFPVISLTRTWGGETAATCASFVMLNRAGWFVTSRHLIEPDLGVRGDLRVTGELRAEMQAIGHDKGLKRSVRDRELARISARADPSWIEHFDVWWGSPHAKFKPAFLLPGIDIAVARLEPVAAHLGEAPAVLMDPVTATAPRGLSLCRLGFAQPQVGAFYDDSTGWDLDVRDLAPVALMDTVERELNRPGGPFPLRWIETSNPALPGLSGGPIFDSAGRIWGIQSENAAAWEVADGSVETYDRSRGRAVHVETVASIVEFFGALVGQD